MALSPSDLTGLFKEAYPDEVLNLVPEAAKIIKMTEFQKREKLGNK